MLVAIEAVLHAQGWLIRTLIAKVAGVPPRTLSLAPNTSALWSLTTSSRCKPVGSVHKGSATRGFDAPSFASNDSFTCVKPLNFSSVSIYEKVDSVVEE